MAYVYINLTLNRGPGALFLIEEQEYQIMRHRIKLATAFMNQDDEKVNGLNAIDQLSLAFDGLGELVFPTDEIKADYSSEAGIITNDQYEKIKEDCGDDADLSVKAIIIDVSLGDNTVQFEIVRNVFQSEVSFDPDVFDSIDNLLTPLFEEKEPEVLPEPEQEVRPVFDFDSMLDIEKVDWIAEKVAKLNSISRKDVILQIVAAAIPATQLEPHVDQEPESLLNVGSDDQPANSESSQEDTKVHAPPEAGIVPPAPPHLFGGQCRVPTESKPDPLFGSAPTPTPAVVDPGKSVLFGDEQPYDSSKLPKNIADRYGMGMSIFMEHVDN